MTLDDLTPSPAPTRLRWLHVAGLAALVAVLFGFRLGQDMPLRNHEALLAETARNMYLDHPITRPDGQQPSPWLVPNFNGSDRLKKTPLPYWTVAGLARIAGGVDEWTARLPAAAAAVLTVLVLVWFVRRLADPLTALLAGAAFATFSLVMVVGREAQADMPLALLVTVSLAAMWMGVEQSGSRRFAWFAASGLAGGLAMMAKGPMPLVVVPGPFVAAAVIIVLRLRRQARAGQGTRGEWLWTIAGAVVAVALFVGIFLPWVIKVPGAWGTLWSESVDRAVGELGHKKHESIFFYLTRLPAVVAPWTIFFVWGIAEGIRRFIVDRASRERLAYVGAWFFGTLAAISYAEGKQDHYILPALPAAAVFTALALRRLLGPGEPAQQVHGRRLVAAHAIAGLAAGVLGAVLGILLLADPTGVPKYLDKLVAEGSTSWLASVVSGWRWLCDTVITLGPKGLVLVCGLATVGSAAACVLAFRRRLVAGFVTLVVALAAVFVSAWPTFMGPMDGMTMVAGFAREVRTTVPADAPLYDFPDASGTLVYYVERRIVGLTKPEDVQAKVAEGRPFYLIAAEDHSKQLADIPGLRPVLHRTNIFWPDEGIWLFYFAGSPPPSPSP
jgi:4-amino-4-deoxy-L-arabinose transferase-like glycosyltransferase